MILEREREREREREPSKYCCVRYWEEKKAQHDNIYWQDLKVYSLRIKNRLLF